MKSVILKTILAFDKLFYYLGRIVAKSRSELLFPGKRLVQDYSVVIKYPEKVDMGYDVWVGPNVSIGAFSGIRLGDRVRISQGAFIETASLDIRAERLPYEHVGKPIRIDDGVWIGAHAVILGGVHIGERAVIAAGAVVVKDVPAHAIVAAAPARPIGSRAPQS
ncbi:acyltransferase [Sphingopyxis granuli]|uniref:acyltransferase n=1 Tax=Sphingopyxis granuli TaxID=267128 RepID=UPI001BAEF22D|nr:DapH/DapD/GlmU-related protein [Sphingopyxis granuli]QUM71324.1 acyltransferase [Sphingopyxis granuli]